VSGTAVSRTRQPSCDNLTPLVRVVWDPLESTLASDGAEADPGRLKALVDEVMRLHQRLMAELDAAAGAAAGGEAWPG
jgi:hypothetical protein